ncbi:PP2C family protein-serine/threonine phosphatase [Streptomyces sp. NPDC058611]
MLEMLTRILDDGHLCSFDQLPGLVAGHAGRAGMDNVRIFLADLREQVLREATGRGIDAAEGGETLLIEGTLPGRVFTTIRPLPGPEATPRRWWVPILDGTERIGVLGADLADGVETEQLNTLASLVGLLVVGKRPHSDAHPRLVRTEAMNLAAELQWNLMPPRSFANSNVVVAAAMEPAYEVGGDAFDYAIAGDQVHLGIFDAMGHDSHAGLAANVAVTACRNQRRQDTDLVTTSERIEESLIEHFGHNTYVTAVLGDVNADTGLFSWINRGHHPPILIRAGRWTTALSCPSPKPCVASCGPSWTTTTDASPTTPPSCAWNGTAPAATNNYAPQAPNTHASKQRCRERRTETSRGTLRTALERTSHPLGGHRAWSLAPPVTSSGHGEGT